MCNSAHFWPVALKSRGRWRRSAAGSTRAMTRAVFTYVCLTLFFVDVVFFVNIPWVALTAQHLIVTVRILNEVTLVFTDFRVMKYGMYAFNAVENLSYEASPVMGILLALGVGVDYPVLH